MIKLKFYVAENSESDDNKLKSYHKTIQDRQYYWH